MLCAMRAGVLRRTGIRKRAGVWIRRLRAGLWIRLRAGLWVRRIRAGVRIRRIRRAGIRLERPGPGRRASLGSSLALIVGEIREHSTRVPHHAPLVDVATRIEPDRIAVGVV